MMAFYFVASCSQSALAHRSVQVTEKPVTTPSATKTSASAPTCAAHPFIPLRRTPNCVGWCKSSRKVNSRSFMGGSHAGHSFFFAFSLFAIVFLSARCAPPFFVLCASLDLNAIAESIFAYICWALGGWVSPSCAVTPSRHVLPVKSALASRV
jgi:hypothetical protein